MRLQTTTKKSSTRLGDSASDQQTPTVGLELDNGAEVTLEPGDVFTQNGTRHRWPFLEDIQNKPLPVRRRPGTAGVGRRRTRRWRRVGGLCREVRRFPDWLPPGSGLWTAARPLGGTSRSASHRQILRWPQGLLRPRTDSKRRSGDRRRLRARRHRARHATACRRRRGRLRVRRRRQQTRAGRWSRLRSSRT